jgi:S1-C subfamily serine protease
MWTKLKTYLTPLLAGLVAAAGAVLGGHLVPKAEPAAPPPATTPVTPPVVIVPPPVAPLPPPPPKPAEDPKQAVVQIQLGNSGCTATVIDAKRSDDRYWLLTASHCVNDVGQRGMARLRDGREFPFTVQSFDRKADCAWLLSEPTKDVYPWLLLAEISPEVGSKVWHAGFGVDKPGNVEQGVVVAKPNADGQVQFNLSVSSGDSGGGIALNDSGQVVSPVCCTTAKGQYANVWGAAPESCRKLRPKTSVAGHLEPD